MNPIFSERFDHLTTPEANSGCLLWIGGTDKDGYGLTRFNSGRRTLRAHRVSYEVNIGPIPPRILVCHKCDTPPCVNPDHLFLGTVLDNSRDSVKKGRWGRGEKIRNQLTEKQVREIASDPRMPRIVAKDYGTSQSNVSEIKRGGSWAHLKISRLNGGSWLRGEAKGGAKLKQAEAEMAFLDKRLATVVAKELGVKADTIRAIRKGDTWIHIFQKYLGVG